MSNRILIVDDEPSVVEAVKLILKDSQYEVIVAYDGQEAINQVRAQNPALLVLDLMLPKIDGYTVHKMLQSDRRYANIPVIILTACGDLGRMKKGMETGAIAYVVKPFDHKILLGIIKAVLELKQYDERIKKEIPPIG